MFTNHILTDGYTCRVIFAESCTTNETTSATTLELEDFSWQEIKSSFRPCTLDPGRNHLFTSYHGRNQIRSMSTKEYYSYGGTIHRRNIQDKRKIQENFKPIETGIPTAKTTSIEKYRRHVHYLVEEYLNRLLGFYNQEIPKDRWLNYLAKWKAIEETTNILINGGLKYTKKGERESVIGRREEEVEI
jgi:hypothetical protein